MSLVSALGFSRDQARFAAVVAAHQDRVYGFALHVTGDEEEAQDVAQEAFIRLWTHRDHVGEAAVRSWLLRTTRNLAIDRHRRKRFSVPDDGVCDETPSSEPSPLDEAERGSVGDEVYRALGTLREPYRSLVLLREVQELSYDEISDVLGLPLASVKVYLHRARKMLRDAYLRHTGEPV